jgi:hypothetical protein
MLVNSRRRPVDRDLVKRLTTSLAILAAAVAVTWTSCSSDAPKAKRNDDGKDGDGADSGDPSVTGGTGLCSDASLTASSALPFALDGAKPSFVALSLEGVIGSGKAAAGAATVRLALPQLDDTAAAHFEETQQVRQGYNATVGMLPPGRYDLTVTLLDSSGATLVEGTACLQINSGTDYVLALDAAGSALNFAGKKSVTPGNDPYTNFCTSGVYDLLCDTPPETAALQYCTIPAKGDTPTGFNAITRSQCLGEGAVIRASCTSRAITREDFGLVACAAPTFTTSALDADQVVLNHLWNEKDGVKCGGFDVSYVVETGHLKVGLCAAPDASSLTWSTADLTGADKDEFEGLLAKLDGSHADGAFCDGGYQQQLDATGGQGLVDTPYVVFKRDGGTGKTLAAGDFAGACSKFDPEALEAVLAYLREL